MQLLAESDIAHRKCFVHDQDFRVDMRGNGKARRSTIPVE